MLSKFPSQEQDILENMLTHVELCCCLYIYQDKVQHREAICEDSKNSRLMHSSLSMTWTLMCAKAGFIVDSYLDVFWVEPLSLVQLLQSKNWLSLTIFPDHIF